MIKKGGGDNETYQYREIDVREAIGILVNHRKSIIGFTAIATLGIFLLSVFSVKTTFQGNAVLSIGHIEGEPIETYNQIIDTLLTDKNVRTSKSSNEKTVSLSVEESSLARAKEKIELLVKGILERHAVILEQEVKEKSDLLNGQIAILNQSLEKNQKQLVIFQAALDRFSSTNFIYEGQGLAVPAYLSSFNNAVEKDTGIRERLQPLQAKLPVAFEASKQVGEPSITSIPSGKRIAVSTISAAMLGLFVSCLWAFANAWWQKIRPIPHR